MNANRAAFDVNAPVDVLDFFKRLFSPDFMPHGHCYFYRPDVLWLSVASDALIALAYYAIPISLLYIVIKRGDIPFHWIFFLFGLFICACGTTHVMGILTVWIGMYRLEGIVKLITAIVSVLTAVLLIRLLPKILSLPSLEEAILNLNRKKTDLEQSNKKLQQTQELFLSREERILALKAQINALSAELGKEPPYKS